MSKSEVSAAKHTPGPWRISQNVSRHVVGPNGGIVTCGELTWDGPGSTEVADANARLIAAAPEMLELLQAVSAALYLNDYGDWALNSNFNADGIDQIIAKATGSTQ